MFSFSADSPWCAWIKIEQACDNSQPIQRFPSESTMRSAKNDRAKGGKQDDATQRRITLALTGTNITYYMNPRL